MTETISKLIQFRYRAINVEHSCQHGTNEEPEHSHTLNMLINDIVRVIEGMEFKGIIKSSVNSFQLDVTDFDDQWVALLNNDGWQGKQLNIKNELPNLPSIKPDALLKKANVALAIEIEKSNEKTVWFDFIKLLMLIGETVADFGILVVPKNYAFSKGQWDLFAEARYYRWCLEQFAKVDSNLLSKIAIIGYKQEVFISDKWVPLTKNSIKTIKELARIHFSNR